MLFCVPGGRGPNYVPDIPSLQAWLECAWAAGFDALGCQQLGGAVRGRRTWIGTTEVACLLRYFGVRAHIVDFYGASTPCVISVLSTEFNPVRPCHSVKGTPSDS